MAHNASKVCMGNVATTFKHIENFAGEVEAGLVCYLKSDGTVSNSSADGSAIGVSCGKPLDGTKRTTVVRSGTSVPFLLNGASPTVGGQVAGFNAIYGTGPLTAMKEDGTEAAGEVALIDMPGGL